MGSARTVTAEDIQTRVNYELRNTYKVQFTPPETLAYINKWLEFTHQYLIESGSDLVRTGTGTITTVVNTEKYSLTDNDMGDLWTPYRVWPSEYDELEMALESDRQEYVTAQEQGVIAYSIPNSYYIEGDYIGLLPFPDEIYTINIKYYPEFAPLALVTDTIPYRNLFNLQLEEGAKILAKNRENYGTSVDAALMELFKERAKSIVDMRQKRNVKLSVYSPCGGYNG